MGSSPTIRRRTKRTGTELCSVPVLSRPPVDALNPRVQGLASFASQTRSVGSAGKRSTGPFSVSASPHHPQDARLFVTKKMPFVTEGLTSGCISLYNIIMLIENTSDYYILYFV